MRLFADADPGMMNKDIRTGGIVLVFDIGLVSLGTWLWNLDDPLAGRAAILVGFGPAAFISSITWFALLRSKRLLVCQTQSDVPLVEYSGYEKEQTVDPTEGDDVWPNGPPRFSRRDRGNRHLAGAAECSQINEIYPEFQVFGGSVGEK
ncbi:hypothetical protein GE09DRAFT_1134342 [Coniochaeta sp. 2T2.1]|nr:hypothetical protein GE09DRAFT_1134342 [Coniochaeta sp. 2T2.1]